MEKRKLHVMHIILNLKRDGAQQVVRTLAEYLTTEDCIPVVCAFQDGPMRSDIERLGVKVELLPPRRYSIFVFPLFVVDLIRIWRALIKLVNHYQVQIVQTHLLETFDFPVLLLRYMTSAGVVIWTFHNSNIGLTKDQLTHQWLLKPKRYAHNLLYRLTFPMVNGAIAVSDQVKEAMLQTFGHVEDKITVISNGVDVKRYNQPIDKAMVRSELGFSGDTPLLAMVGRLQEQKGHRYLIEAVSIILPEYPEIQVLFIGEGDLRDELQSQVETLKLGRHIHFLGSRPDVPQLLAASDVFVLPSLWEGLSMALLEAMAIGLPVVASEVSGTVQVILPNETGYLVPPRDVPALAKAIIQVLSDPARSQAMGIAARQRVEMAFSAQKQAAEHLALYRRLLDSNQKANS
jgi:glycosyltransferase involved in cell wall biosynthesis